jgi:hypothetical protein
MGLFKIIEVLASISNFPSKLEQKQKPKLEITDDGFFLKYPYTLVKDKFVPWQSVNEIRSLMCESFVGHYLYLQFITDTEKKSVMVHDSMQGWDILYIEVLKHFPDFNVENFQKTEKFFPQEGCLVCWKRK